ncbi:MAG: hypothetical protein H7Y88_05470 [Phycisphaerales bacterium]|nr:hypothetical protein [Phycisphaerales bacterium]
MRDTSRPNGLVVAMTGLAIGAAAAAPARATDTYVVTLSSSSSVNSTFDADASIFGTFIGNHDPVNNPDGTMTRTGLFGSCGGTANTAIGFTASGGAGGASTTTPAGGFRLTVNPAAGTASISELSLDLLGAAEPSFPLSAEITFGNFRTCQPTSAYIGITLPIPIGEATLMDLTAVQTAGAGAGTLLATATPNQYTFIVPVEVILTAGVAIAEAPAEPTEQTVLVPIVGTVTLNGCTATVSFSLDSNVAESSTDDIDGPQDLAFDLPTILPPGSTAHLLVDMTFDSVSVGATIDASVTGTGQIVFKPADFNRDCIVNSADITAFLQAWFSDLANGTTLSNFDSNPAVNSADITAFLQAWFAGLN